MNYISICYKTTSSHLNCSLIFLRHSSLSLNPTTNNQSYFGWKTTIIDNFFSNIESSAYGYDRKYPHHPKVIQSIRMTYKNNMLRKRETSTSINSVLNSMTVFPIILTQSLSQKTNLALFLLSATTTSSLYLFQYLDNKLVFQHNIILNLMKSIQQII